MKNRSLLTNQINALHKSFVTAFPCSLHVIGDRIIAPHGHPELWELVPYDPDAHVVPAHPPLKEEAVIGCLCAGCIQNREWWPDRTELKPEEVGNGARGKRTGVREPVAVTVARLALPPEDNPRTFRGCAAQDLQIAANCRRRARRESQPVADALLCHAAVYEARAAGFLRQACALEEWRRHERSE